jgi:hypothetical protein
MKIIFWRIYKDAVETSRLNDKIYLLTFIILSWNVSAIKKFCLWFHYSVCFRMHTLQHPFCSAPLSHSLTLGCVCSSFTLDLFYLHNFGWNYSWNSYLSLTVKNYFDCCFAPFKRSLYKNITFKNERAKIHP